MKTELLMCFLLIKTALMLNCSRTIATEYNQTIDDNAAVIVNVSLTLEEIYFTSTSNMDFEATVLLHQHWVDLRLGSNPKTKKMAVSGQIWRPKITITKGCFKICSNTDETQFWRGYGEESNILLSQKMVIKSSCTKNLRKYPFDIQICELKFGTYVFPIDEVDLIWEKNSVEILTGTNLNEFELINVTTFHEVDLRLSGNFRSLVVQFFVKRYFSNYVMSIIIPCTLLVALSYASFWIDHERIDFRLTMCLVCLLFLIHIYVICAKGLIGSRDLLNALDLFFILCLIFIAFALFENGIISYMMSHVRIISKNEVDHKSIINWIQRSVKILYPIFYCMCLLLYFYKVMC